MGEREVSEIVWERQRRGNGWFARVGENLWLHAWKDSWVIWQFTSDPAWRQLDKGKATDLGDAKSQAESAYRRLVGETQTQKVEKAEHPWVERLRAKKPSNDPFIQGYACAVANLLGGHGDSTMVRELMSACGLTREACQAAGVDEFDMERLKIVWEDEESDI